MLTAAGFLTATWRYYSVYIRSFLAFCFGFFFCLRSRWKAGSIKTAVAMAGNHTREKGAHMQQLLGFLTHTYLHCCHSLSMLPDTHGLGSSSSDFSTLSNCSAIIGRNGSHLRLLTWIIHYAICIKVREEELTFRCNSPCEEKSSVKVKKGIIK